MNLMFLNVLVVVNVDLHNAFFFLFFSTTPFFRSTSLHVLFVYMTIFVVLIHLVPIGNFP